MPLGQTGHMLPVFPEFQAATGNIPSFRRECHKKILPLCRLDTHGPFPYTPPISRQKTDRNMIPDSIVDRVFTMEQPPRISMDFTGREMA